MPGDAEAFKKGESIFRQDDPGEAFYYICQGSISVQIYRIGVSRLGAGNCFGEMAILDRTPRSAFCLTLEDSELLRLSETELELLLKSQPGVALALLKMLVRKLSQ